MCGIAGLIQFNNIPVDESIIRKMNSFLVYRGPDDEGYWSEGPVGFSHRRLSIIDLSSNGKQPMLDVSKKVVITYNGEIYNYIELKKDLSKKGHLFVSDTDTEVIINGYKEWGIGSLLNKIDGMFAFVIYDIERNIAFACRDIFGKKPLYYCRDSKKISFSSDIRSIWATEKNLSLDFETVNYFLTELSSPQPKTIWNEIKQVRHSHYLFINIKENSVQELPYFQVKSSPSTDLNTEDLIIEVEAKLTKAIMKRTVGDEKVASFLSGGIDSGLIVALLAQNSKERIKTYSVGIDDIELNELSFAQKVAERYNTDHHTIIIQPDIISVLPSIIQEFGEPFADSSNLPSYYIAKEMRKHSKVALSGDGGDEIFGGYHDYAWALRADTFNKQFGSKRARQFVSCFSKIASRLNISKVNLGHVEAYSKFSGGMKLYRNIGFNPYEVKEIIMNDDSYSLNYLDHIWDKFQSDSILDTLFAASLDTRLVNDYLVKIDRTSMMNSLEVRCPFLDKELVELSFSIPGATKIHLGQTKFILKKIAQKHIDVNIFQRKKMGFDIPLSRWLRTSLKEFAMDILQSTAFYSRFFLNHAKIQMMLNEHMTGKRNHANKLWALISLELWMEQFYDNRN